MKTKEELNALKEEVETVSRKLAELTEEELAQVTGGTVILDDCINNCGGTRKDFCKYTKCQFGHRKAIGLKGGL